MSAVSWRRQNIKEGMKSGIITDLAIPGDDRMKGKELEKLEKYQLLKDQIAKVWRMQIVIVVPVVIRALGALSVNFKDYMKRIGVNVWLEVIQKTALLWTAKIPRKVLSLYEERKERSGTRCHLL